MSVASCDSYLRENAGFARKARVQSIRRPDPAEAELLGEIRGDLARSDLRGPNRRLPQLRCGRPLRGMLCVSHCDDHRTYNGVFAKLGEPTRFCGTRPPTMRRSRTGMTRPTELRAAQPALPRPISMITTRATASTHPAIAPTSVESGKSQGRRPRHGRPDAALRA